MGLDNCKVNSLLRHAWLPHVLDVLLALPALKQLVSNFRMAWFVQL
jgi:hypothetical protein